VAFDSVSTDQRERVVECVHIDEASDVVTEHPVVLPIVTHDDEGVIGEHSACQVKVSRGDGDVEISVRAGLLTE